MSRQPLTHWETGWKGSGLACSDVRMLHPQRLLPLTGPPVIQWPQHQSRTPERQLQRMRDPQRPQSSRVPPTAPSKLPAVLPLRLTPEVVSTAGPLLPTLYAKTVGHNAFLADIYKDMMEWYGQQCRSHAFIAPPQQARLPSRGLLAA